MGHSKARVDEAEMADLLAMKADVAANCEETTKLKEDMELLHRDVLAINTKQDSMNKVIGSVQTAVMAFS